MNIITLYAMRNLTLVAILTFVVNSFLMSYELVFKSKNILQE